MSCNRHRSPPYGGSAPATPRFSAVAPEWLCSYGAAVAAPVIPAAESTLGSHPCVALSSAQVSPEWINTNLAVDHFPSDGDYPLNFVSHPRGSLHPLHDSGPPCYRDIILCCPRQLETLRFVPVNQLYVGISSREGPQSFQTYIAASGAGFIPATRRHTVLEGPGEVARIASQ